MPVSFRSIPVPNQSRKSFLRRIATATFACAAVAISLLTFPNAILWMVAAWLLFFIWIRKTAKFAWIPLVVCVAILLVKGPYWSTGLIALVFALLVVAVQSEWLRRTGNPATDLRGAVGVGALWLLWCAALWESHRISHTANTNQLDINRPVVCLGDSLTTGLTDSEAYPRYLADEITLPVVDLGRPGITAREALKQLPAVLKANPQVVIIELGGHDFLRGAGRHATQRTLEQIVGACQDAGADVVLWEIPRGFIHDPYSGIERQLAHKFDAQLIPDSAIRQLVLRSSTFPLSGWLGNEPLSTDGLHRNKAGAQFLSRAVFDTLEQMYGPSIIRTSR